MEDQLMRAPFSFHIKIMIFRLRIFGQSAVQAMYGNYEVHSPAVDNTGANSPFCITNK